MANYSTGKCGTLKGRALKRRRKSAKKTASEIRIEGNTQKSMPSKITLTTKKDHPTLGFITIEDVRETNKRICQKYVASPICTEDKYSKMGDEILIKIRKKMNRDSINQAYRNIISKS